MLYVVCPVLYVVHKTWTKINLGMKVSFNLQVTLHCWGQEPGGQNWSQDREGPLLTGLPPGSHSATYTSQSTCSGTALPGSSCINWQSRKGCTNMPTCQLLAVFSTEPAQFIKTWWKNWKNRKLRQLLVIIWALRNNLVVLSGTK